MYFECLVMRNLGVFRGEHRVNLAPAYPNRPLVLVGALNGSGKTTFIEALQLVLYGKRAGFGWRGIAAYPEYLTHIRNRYAKSADDTFVEVSLRHANGQKWRVRRQWSFLKASPRETLAVYVDDDLAPDLALSEGWDDEVERLLPVRLSELFFFDGEKIEKLADPAKSGEVLKTAIGSLMGLDLVDHLTADLEILRGRLRRELLAEEAQQQLMTLEADRLRLRQELEDVRQRQAETGNRLDRARDSLNATHDRLKAQGGDLFKQRESIAAERATTLAQIESLHTRQREIATGPLPLALVQSDLKRVSNRANEAIKSGSEVVAAALQQEYAALMQWLKERKQWSARARDELTRYVTERATVSGLAKADQTGIDWPAVASRMTSLNEERIKTALQEMSLLDREEQRLGERLLWFEDQMHRMPDLEQLALLLREAGGAEEEVRSIEREQALLKDHEGSCARRLEAIDRHCEESLRKVLLSDDAARAADYCGRSIKTLERFRSELIERRRKQLEQRILQSFMTLARKSDLITEVSISPTDMVLQLRGADGNPVGTQQLSAGERQLLAIAILWGLAQASGRPVPVVIDTPLGRLDGEHRKALVERYFPDASHQVILLSTDQEVGREYSEMLDDSVTHRYLIDYCPAAKSSSFSEGYF